MAVHDQPAQHEAALLHLDVPSRQGLGQLSGVAHVLPAQQKHPVIGAAQGLKGLRIELFQVGKIFLGLGKGQYFFPYRPKNLMGDLLPAGGNEPLVRQKPPGQGPAAFGGDGVGPKLNFSLGLAL